MTNRVNVFVLLIAAVLVIGCQSAADNPARKQIHPAKAPPPVPRVINDAIDPELRDKALAELNEAAKSNDEILRANAIEGLQESVGVEARGPIVHALEDSNPVVRFAAAMAAGTLRLKEAMPILNDLASDANSSVRVAARYALHRLGDTRLSHDLEKMSVDPERAVRANVAFVLGRLGDKSALYVLRTMLNDSAPSVRIQVAEAMWRLGDQQGLESLVAASVSQAPDDQIIAVLALAALKNPQVTGQIYGKLVSDYPEVSLAAARAMGVLGSDRGYAIATTGTHAATPRERALAALALGSIGRSDAQPALRRLLGDKEASVRLAAATAILQLKPPPQK